MDDCSRCEVDVVLESAQDEIQAVEDGWLSCAGPPHVLRLDTAGWHMSNYYKEWAGRHNIKLDFVPKLAHHLIRTMMLGMLERNHTAR